MSAASQKYSRQSAEAKPTSPNTFLFSNGLGLLIADDRASMFTIASLTLGSLPSAGTSVIHWKLEWIKRIRPSWPADAKWKALQNLIRGLIGRTMPIYEYTCDDCSKDFARLQQVGKDSKTITCPSCHGGHVKRKISTFSGGAAKTAGSSIAASGPSCSGYT